MKLWNARVRSDRRTTEVKEQSRGQHARAMHLRALRFDRRGSCPGVRSRSRRKGRSRFARHAEHVRKPKRKRSSLAAFSWIASIINARVASHSVSQLNQFARLKERHTQRDLHSIGRSILFSFAKKISLFLFSLYWIFSHFIWNKILKIYLCILNDNSNYFRNNTFIGIYFYNKENVCQFKHNFARVMQKFAVITGSTFNSEKGKRHIRRSSRIPFHGTLFVQEGQLVPELITDKHSQCFVIAMRRSTSWGLFAKR